MRPASVDWYLARVAMRFENKGTCNRDVQVLKVGEVTQANLARQSRRDKVMTISGCRSRGRRRSSNSSRRFFLQPKDDAVHKGAPPSQWRTYVHVKRSSDAPGGYDLQYWFFYPFNDSAASLNHEGDWEHITVTTDAAGSFVEAYYSQHEGGEVYSAEELQRTHGDHPVVYVADGSHASYNKRGKFDIPGVPRFDDRTYDGGPVWRTWSTLVFVGEKEFPRNKQNFLHFGGRWGEIGLKKTTSGPTGPAFKERWNTR